MIFLSLGTHEQPFERAVELVRPLAERGEHVVIQHGFTEPRADIPNVEWRRLIPYDELVELLHQTRGFLCHAGVGSIMTALGAGVTPIVLARASAYGEHVDDHQLQIASRLADEGLVIHLTDGDVEAALTRAASLGARRTGVGELHRHIAQIVDTPRGRA